MSGDVVLNNVRFTRVQRAVNTINLDPGFHMYALTTGSVRGSGMVLIHGKILRLPSEKIEISGEMTFERNTSMSAPLDSGKHFENVGKEDKIVNTGRLTNMSRPHHFTAYPWRKLAKSGR